VLLWIGALKNAENGSEGLRSSMVRRWTVLVSLLAQGIALMSPACLLRCVALDEHETIELFGQDCHGCHEKISPEEPLSAKCCAKPHHDHGRPPVAATLNAADDCGCRHSRLDLGPQSVAKPLAAKTWLQNQSLLLAKLPSLCATTDAAVAPRWISRQRPPCWSPQLELLATVVLRA
jgi:hypothetical protein